MIKAQFALASLSLILLCCSVEEKKLYIKTVTASGSVHVDWYFQSLLSNFTRSYLQFRTNNNEQKKFFESFYVSNIAIKGDSLLIQLYENNYKVYVDEAKESGLTITIDTTGGIWNQASSRLGRLHRKGVDIHKPHNAESYCPDMECINTE